MPGINLIINKGQNSRGWMTATEQALQGTKTSDDYEVSELYAAPNTLLSVSLLPDYPFFKFENNEYLLVVEGDIYNKQEERSLFLELVSIARSLFRYGREEKVLLKHWMQGADGDYLILAVEKKTGRCLLFNDPLGRLPVYLHQGKNFTVASRNISLPAGLIRPAPDRMGLAAYLATGYSWGKKSLFEGVEYFPSGSLAIFDPDGGVEVEKIYPFNFDEVNETYPSVDEAADHLHELFLNSVRLRYSEKRKNILSLSGGLDSRAILGACHQLGLEIDCKTYIDYEKQVLKDVRVAEKLAASFNANLELIELDAPLGENYIQLLRMKYGLNYMDMGFILPFFKEIKKENLAYFTGDGGDKMLPSLHPHGKLSGRSALINYILKTQKQFSLKQVRRLTGIKPYRIREYLEEVLDSYPEERLENKLVHFLIFERAGNWLFEGEDRNRHFFRNIAPFYSLPFFEAAMLVPEGFKKDYKMFGAFLEKVSPELNRIENANWGFSLHDKRLKRLMWRQRFKFILPDFIRPPKICVHRKHNYLSAQPSSQISECFKKQLAALKGTPVIEGFSQADKLCPLSKDQLFYLLSVASAVELIETGKSSLEDYRFEEVG